MANGRITVRGLVDDIARAAEADQPLPSVAACLRTYAEHRESILDALGFLSGEGSDAEQSFYRAPNLSILKVVFAPGSRTPPHDHGTWAAILMLSGVEQNSYWREAPEAGLTLINSAETGPGDVSPMPPEAIHTVACAGSEPAIGLHVYGRDLLSVERRVWDPETFEAFPLTDERYAELAARAATS